MYRLLKISALRYTTDYLDMKYFYLNLLIFISEVKNKKK